MMSVSMLFLVFITHSSILHPLISCSIISLSLKTDQELPLTKYSRVHLKTIPSIEDLPRDWIVWLSYGNSINRTGWGQIEIHTNPDVTDSYQAYFSGFIEGFLTSNLIQDHFHNLLDGYCIQEVSYCNRVTSYLERNLKFATSQVRKSRDVEPYWHQVGLMLEQLSGLEDGYKLSLQSPGNREADQVIFDAHGPRIGDPHVLSQPGSLLWLNLITELFDLEYVFNRTTITNADEDGYCSALVKLVPEKGELFVGHTSWISYNYMLRMVKKYDFHYHMTNSDDAAQKVIIPSCAISFSSYPGVIFSIDDFYLLSTGLVVTETSIQNSNPDLYKFVDEPEKVVLEFMRVMIANRLAQSAKEWTEIFASYNSGTYNNQFMIVDYNRFSQWLHYRSYNTSEKDILWVVEQMPGSIESADLTCILLQKKYFASYNRAYFEKIFKISGATKFVDAYGDYYTYKRTPRALIFERDQDKVINLYSMYQIMRYNDFKKDPLSRCTSCSPPYTGIAAIAARNDLNDPNGHYPIPPFGFRGSGAIDAKVTSHALMVNMEFVAISSPTYEDQPPFSWSTTDPSISSRLRHAGHPDLFKFEPQHIRWFPHRMETASLL